MGGESPWRQYLLVCCAKQPRVCPHSCRSLFESLTEDTHSCRSIGCFDERGAFQANFFKFFRQHAQGVRRHWLLPTVAAGRFFLTLLGEMGIRTVESSVLRVLVSIAHPGSRQYRECLSFLV